MELGSKNHNGDGFLGPNSIMVVYIYIYIYGPSGLQAVGLRTRV